MDLLYEYKAYLSTTYSKTTMQTYYLNIKLYFDFLDNSPIRILNATKTDILNYLAYIDNLSANTKENRLMSIKNYYNYVDKDLCKELFDDIVVFKQQRLPHYLTLEEAKLLINYYSTTNQRNHLILHLFLTTGIRESELINIEIKDINLEKKTIKIMAKNRVEREVAITENVKKLLEDYMGEDGKLFNIGRREVIYIVKKAMNALGLKGSVHTLRHTFATIMYEQTGDILVVKELLGHVSIESTMVYTHVCNERVKEAVENNPLADYGGNYESKIVR